MLVSIENFNTCLQEIDAHSLISLDTETTGLKAFLQDELFSVIIGTSEKSYYFNFQDYGQGFDTEFVLPRTLLHELRPTLRNPERTVFMHNAKFDMAMLFREGVEVTCKVHDTEVFARLLYNDHMSYKLEDVAAREGFKKDDAVEHYIKKKKLWEWLPRKEGKKKRDKKLFYQKVPPSIIIPYGEKDAEITLKLGVIQLDNLVSFDEKFPEKPLIDVYSNEKTLTHVCFEMEKKGLRVDLDYCEKASRYEKHKMDQATEDFFRLTGIYFTDSGKVFTKAFEKFGIKAPKTKKGNDSFEDKFLQTLDNPVARAVLQYRKSAKQRNTYYENFIHLADSTGLVHGSIRQAGTKTGRFSMADPNFQNVPKREDEDDIVEKEPFTIRKSIIPLDGHEFFEIDFKAMEFRMMLDYAGERGLISAIRDDGLDPHQATANLTGLPRKKAKTLNFALLYGMGIKKLAIALSCTEEEAKKFKRQYFDALMYVEALIKKATYQAKQRGYVYNWAGRRYYYPDPNLAYRATNSIIQGGCSEAMKFAMVKIHEHLKSSSMSMVIQVHDSLLLQNKPEDREKLSGVLDILRAAYPHRALPMDVSVKHSNVSWDDMVDFKI